MVFHFGDDDLIPGAEPAPAVALRNQVDSFRCPAHEDDFLVGCGVDEGLYSFPGRLVGFRRLFAQGMHAAVDVGIVIAIVFVQRLDDLARLLRGGGIVQVHQGLAAHGLLQDGKVLPVALHGEIGGGQRILRPSLRVTHCMNSSISPVSGNSPAMLCSSRCRISGNLISRITSSANA